MWSFRTPACLMCRRLCPHHQQHTNTELVTEPQSQERLLSTAGCRLRFKNTQKVACNKQQNVRQATVSTPTRDQKPCFKREEITLSRELLFSGFLSGRLFPESVLMREPLESAFLTLLMLGVEAVYGEAKRKVKQDQVLVRQHEMKINTKF